MYANGAFKNPFADFDFSKISGEFKLPTVNVETFVETARKNFATMTSLKPPIAPCCSTAVPSAMSASGTLSNWLFNQGT